MASLPVSALVSRPFAERLGITTTDGRVTGRWIGYDRDNQVAILIPMEPEGWPFIGVMPGAQTLSVRASEVTELVSFDR